MSTTAGEMRRLQRAVLAFWLTVLREVGLSVRRRGARARAKRSAVSGV
jgi:hypothetical protein